MTQSFTLVLPPGYTYTTTWAHHAKVDGADLENHRSRWDIDNQAAIDLEHVPMSPGEGALAARMTVHYAGPGLAQPQDGTWQGIGEWYAGLARDRVGVTPEIAAKTDQLVAGKTDFYDKAQALGEFVQKQIRAADMRCMGIWPGSIRMCREYGKPMAERTSGRPMATATRITARHAWPI